MDDFLEAERNVVTSSRLLVSAIGPNVELARSRVNDPISEWLPPRIEWRRRRFQMRTGPFYRRTEDETESFNICLNPLIARPRAMPER